MDIAKRMLLQFEIDSFFTLEAALLDERKFEEWLDLFSPDMVYRMPLVRNLSYKEIGGEYMTNPLDVSWFDQGKELLTARVAQVRTGVHWAEEPMSRTTHIITNSQIVGLNSMEDVPSELTVKSKFIVQRGRNDDEEHTLMGRREDVLRRMEAGLKISKRSVYLNQAVLMAPNLSFFI